MRRHIRLGGGATCTVTIGHHRTRPISVLGDQRLPRMVDRWFTTHVARRTLRRFRDLAEAGRAVGSNEPA